MTGQRVQWTVTTIDRVEGIIECKIFKMQENRYSRSWTQVKGLDVKKRTMSSTDTQGNNKKKLRG